MPQQLLVWLLERTEPLLQQALYMLLQACTEPLLLQPLLICCCRPYLLSPAAGRWSRLCGSAHKRVPQRCSTSSAIQLLLVQPHRLYVAAGLTY